MSNVKDNANAWKEARIWEILQVVTGFLLVVVTSIVSWVLITVINHGERLATIEASRYTSQDALAQVKIQSQELLEMWTEITTVKGQVGDNEEVIRWIERLETRIGRLEDNQ